MGSGKRETEENEVKAGTETEINMQTETRVTENEG